MECVPDLAFLQMAAASNSDMFNKMLWHPSPAAAAAAAATTSPNSTANSGTMKQRKTNFTSREVEALLNAVADRKDTVLFGVAGGIGWARAWHEVAQQVSAVEGIHRSESDVRKKWTYLKWEAKNTSKPGRDPTSRAVLDILTSQNPGSQPSNSLLEQLLVPGSPSSPNQSRSTVSPVPIAPKKHTAPSQSQQSVSSTNSTQERQSAQSQQTSQLPQPPEVCLKWNSYHSNMRATFPSLLNNEQFVDVTLACEGRSIKCHKVMLSACSSYFEELLSQNPCQHPIVFMRDLKFWEVQALVEFMYSGEVNVTQDRLPSLLAAADALQIKGLAGPSTGSNSAEDTEDDLIHHVQQQQKRVRKRKSTNPTAYPVRSQCLAQNSTKQNVEKTQQTLQHQLKKVQAAPKSTQGVLSSSGYSPPSKTRRDDDPPNSPLALIKDEPLDLGIDSKNQTNRHKNTEPPQIKNEKDENGLSEDETDSRPDDYAYDDDDKRYDNGNDDDPRSSRESTPKNDK